MSARCVCSLTLFLSVLFLAPTLTLAREADQGDVKQGARIYREHCEECHGAEGRGNGPKAPFLSPKPGNFVSAATSVKSDQELLQIIEEGVPRTAMKGWKEQLTKEDQVNVLAYIRSLIHFQPPSLTPRPPVKDSSAASANP